jgi:hypothetical protein
MIPDLASLIGAVGFKLIGGEPGKDIESALQGAFGHLTDRSIHHFT